jgi:hypothetical protein
VQKIHPVWRGQELDIESIHSIIADQGLILQNSISAQNFADKLSPLNLGIFPPKSTMNLNEF